MELEADDLRQQHGDGLAEHAGFGFNTAHAPADDADAVDHGGVGVGADERVGVGDGLFAFGLGEDNRGEVFEVDLVDDAGFRRHGAEVLEGGLAPLQELVTFTVAIVFEDGVQVERIGAAEVIDLDGMVDDEVDGDERVGLLGVGAFGGERVAHGGQVDDAGHAGEVLQQHAGRHHVDVLGGAGGVPFADVFGVGGFEGDAVFVADDVFKKDADGIRQARKLRDAFLFERPEAVNRVVFAADGERLRGAECILACHESSGFYMNAGTVMPRIPSVRSSCARNCAVSQSRKARLSASVSWMTG